MHNFAALFCSELIVTRMDTGEMEQSLLQDIYVSCANVKYLQSQQCKTIANIFSRTCKLFLQIQLIIQIWISYMQLQIWFVRIVVIS